MTHEAKKQLKAQFFGMHIGCKCTYGEDYTEQDTLIGVDLVESIVSTDSGIERVEHWCNDFKLILRPLSDITDQEAIECIELSGQPFGHLIAIDRSNKHIVLEDHREHLLNLTNLSEKTKVADYLRGRNFALPFHGLDVVSEGWAVLETTNQPTG